MKIWRLEKDNKQHTENVFCFMVVYFSSHIWRVSGHIFMEKNRAKKPAIFEIWRGFFLWYKSFPNVRRKFLSDKL
jgi:hypothetical protein